MNKVKNQIAVFFEIAVLVVAVLLSGFGGVKAYATCSEVPMSETQTEDSQTEPNVPQDEDDSLNGLVEGFIARLKAKYGDGYKAYLDTILTEWGTVEEYLLALAGERDDPASRGWREFIGGITETAPIWATILAIIIAVAGFVYKNIKDKRVLNSLKNFKSTTYKGLNKMQEVLLAVGQAQLKQLGCGAMTEAERSALEDAMKKLLEVDKDDGA